VLNGFATLSAQPDVQPAFERVRAAGVRIITVTNGSAEKTTKLLSRAGLSDFVEKTSQSMRLGTASRIATRSANGGS
jgi:2-haloacid dehalogenase